MIRRILYSSNLLLLTYLSDIYLYDKSSGALTAFWKWDEYLYWRMSYRWSDGNEYVINVVQVDGKLIDGVLENK